MIDVRLNQLVKRYGADHPAVDGIDLSVEHGSLWTLLGPSGCGKTTTLKMISGFEPVTSGDIFVGSQRVNDIPAHKRDVTTVFQNYALFPHMRVFHNVAYGLARRNVARAEIRKRVTAMLEVVGLDAFANRYPSELSGGQQQRVALARALVLRPKVILLDEPLSNLDAKLRKRMEVEIRTILHEHNVTAIHVTHDQEEALTMSDMVAVMNAGRIEQAGPPAEIYRHPTTRWVAEFIGISNVLPLFDVRTDREGRVTGRTADRVPIVSRAPHDVGSPEQAWVMIRPEALRARRGDVDPPGTTNSVSGTVAEKIYLGRCARLSVHVPGVDTLVTIDVIESQDDFALGDPIQLEWDPDASWVLTR